MRYKYTYLNQDGTKHDIGTYDEELSFKGTGGLYEILECRTIELIPDDYYPTWAKGNTIFGDEECRDTLNAHRNKHMETIEDMFGSVWDCVGNLVMVEEIE